MATYDIEVTGSGGEITIGSISQESYEYWESQTDEALTSHLFDSSSDIPEDDERYIGNFEDSGDIVHTYGVNLDDCKIVVKDEDGQEIYTTLTPTITRNHIVDHNTLDPGFYLKSLTYEKGMFFQAEIDTDKFNKDLLKFYAKSIDNDAIIYGIEYDNKELETDTGTTKVRQTGQSLYEIL
jgi:lipoprotein-anchoring transpeptidase ErfK/SrfK